MSTKRQPSKQRRQTQNQRQRAALEARRVNATAGPAPQGKVGGASATEPSSAPRGGSVLSRMRGATARGREVRTGRAGGSLPVGHRAALSALLAAIAAAVVGALLIPVPVDAGGDPVTARGALLAEWSLSALDVAQESPEASAQEVAQEVDDWSPNGTKPYGIAYFPLSLGLLLPVVGAALAFRAVSTRAAAKVVNRTMYVTMFGTLLNAQLLFLFLPTLVGVGIAAFQVRKAEVAANAVALAEEPAGDGPPDDGDVIEVDAVEEPAPDAADDADAIEVDAVEEPATASADDADDDGDQRSV